MAVTVKCDNLTDVTNILIYRNVKVESHKCHRMRTELVLLLYIFNFTRYFFYRLRSSNFNLPDVRNILISINVKTLRPFYIYDVPS